MLLIVIRELKCTYKWYVTLWNHAMKLCTENSLIDLTIELAGSDSAVWVLLCKQIKVKWSRRPTKLCAVSCTPCKRKDNGFLLCWFYRFHQSQFKKQRLKGSSPVGPIFCWTRTNKLGNFIALYVHFMRTTLWLVTQRIRYSWNQSYRY